MARAKPKYTGHSTLGPECTDYPQALRDCLREFYPDKVAVEDAVWGHPADNFVNEILAEASWAVAELYRIGNEITVEELRLEHVNLIETLRVTEMKLRTISPDLDRLISIEATPRDCADQIRKLIDHVKAVEPLIKRLPRAKRPEQKKKFIVLELTVRILSVLAEKYGIQTKAWVTEHYKEKSSKAIQILKPIGDEIGLEYDPQTWRKIIRDAIKQKPSLKG